MTNCLTQCTEPVSEEYTISIGEKNLEILAGNDGSLLLDGKALSLVMKSANRVHTVASGGNVHTLYIRQLEDHTYEIWIKHHVLKLKVEDRRTHLLHALEQKSGAVHESVVVRAPMPGLVLDVAIGEGEKVIAGGKLFILEAMKMENEIRAPIGGTVHGLKVRKGDVVEKDQVLIQIKNE